MYSSIGLAGKISTVFHTVCAVRLAGKSLFRPVCAAVYRVSSKISPFSSNQPMCVYTRIRSICAIALSISKSFEIISPHHFEQIRNLFRATLALWSHKHGEGKRVVIRFYWKLYGTLSTGDRSKCSVGMGIVFTGIYTVFSHLGLNFSFLRGFVL